MKTKMFGKKKDKDKEKERERSSTIPMRPGLYYYMKNLVTLQSFNIFFLLLLLFNK